jgi:hypothetical protein
VAIPELLVNTPHRLIDCLDQLRGSLGGDVWWRGQGSSSWPLIAGVHRPGFPDTEKNLTARFIQKVPPRYPEHPQFTDLQGWLFLLQHYRFPTRLLDWTESPLLAMYFAVSERPEEDAALWALNPFGLNSTQFKKSVLFSDFSDEVRLLFAAALQNEAQPLEKIAALSSTERNLRMLVQMARFTSHGSKAPLETVESADTFLAKCLVPASAKPLLSRFLFDVGIRLSNLFPDLEHLARDMLGRKYKPA